MRITDRLLSRLGSVTGLAFRGSLRGLRAAGLAAFAAVPSVLVVAVLSARPTPGALSGFAAGLFGVLTLPIVAMVVVLVLAVGQFRNEIDSETLVYLVDRSVPRPVLTLGKFLGSVGASLVILLPGTLVPLGLAVLGGAPAYPLQVPVGLAVVLALGVVAYAGFFLFLGLVTRSALLVGLLFGFLWEELLPALPGSVPRMTVVYYLRDLLAHLLGAGPLAGYPDPLSAALAVGVLLGVAAFFLGAASWALGILETAPARD